MFSLEMFLGIANDLFTGLQQMNKTNIEIIFFI